MKKFLTIVTVLTFSIFGMKALLNAAASDHLYEDLVIEATFRGEESTQIPCGACESVFSSNQARTEHIYKAHCGKNNGTYTCSYGDCGKTFSCSCQIRPHIRRLHNAARLLEVE